MRTLRIPDDVYGALEAACRPEHAGVDKMAEDILRRELRIASSDTRLPPEAETRLEELLGKNSAERLSSEEEKELDRLVAAYDECTLRRARSLAGGVEPSAR